MRKILFALAFLLVAIPSARAQSTYPAAGCSLAQVQAAFTAEQVHPANGDIITIPTCSSTWSGDLVETVTVSLTVQGNTTISTNCAQPPTFNTACTSTDNTVITDGDTSGNPIMQFNIAGSGAIVFRMTGITLNGGGITEFHGLFNLGGTNTSAQLRVDHNNFTNYFQAAALINQPMANGVWDHNIFTATGSTGNAIRMFGPGNGFAAFAAATPLGSANAIFVENNTFNTTFANDCNSGANYVFRYNVNFTATANQSTIQSHATVSNQYPGGAGCRSEEVYGNYMSSTASGGSFSGEFETSGVLYSWNNVTTGYNHVIDLVSDGDNGGSACGGSETYCQSQPPNGWGYCGPFSSFSNSPWNGGQTTGGSNGWPCIDQPGRGIRQLVASPNSNNYQYTLAPAWVASTSCTSSTLGFGAITDPANHIQLCTSPGTTGTSTPSWNDSGGTTTTGSATYTDQGLSMVVIATSTITWPQQKLEPVYSWNDTCGAPNCTGFISINSPNNNILANRDYYVSVGGVQTSPTSPFNGTTGTGFGTLANRPTTCTAGIGGTYATSPTGSYGVAYFATDANGGIGELYACTSANTWTGVYEPYTYPHPLVTGGSALSPSGSPTSGVVPQTVTVTNPNTGTTDVCYAASPTTPATDGTGTGCNTGTKYTAPISVSSAETLNLIAGTSTQADSSVVSYTYTASPVAPTVTTTAATSITSTSATSGGTVTATGGASVTSEGVCYGLSANPTTPCTSNGTASPFTSPITGLTPSTTYNYRAFATNSAGIGYGSNSTFTTLSTCQNPVAIGAFTACNFSYTDVNTGTSASVNMSPFAGNGIEIIFQYCGNSSCNPAPTQTLVSVSDNVNSPETCFVQAPHSPYAYANTNVPDYETLYAFYCPSIPAGVTSFTVTINATANYLQPDVVEWKAGTIASTGYFENVDNEANAGPVAGTTATVPTNGTTVHASDLITAMIANCGASIPATVGTGYTGLIVNPMATPGHIFEAMAVNSVGVKTATTTWSTGSAPSSCALGTGGSNDTWFGVIVPLIGGVTLTPTSENFGSINVGSSSSPVTFTVTNNSTSTATSISPIVTGGNSGDFSVVNTGVGSCAAASGSLTVGSSCTFTVAFIPLVTGPLSTTLSVTYSGGDGDSPQTAALSGMGTPGGVVGSRMSGGVQISTGVKVQ